MNSTFFKLATDLVANSHILQRIKVANVLVELLETSIVEIHPIETVLRKQLVSLIKVCAQHPHTANAHSLLEIVDFYDKHFISSNELLAIAA